ELRLWDLGGQEAYHAAHALFFSDRALYIIVFDLSRATGSKEDIDKRVQFWV
ncbi:unnamed protein product, partial [Phaeothamnion confervicola]